MPEEGDGYERRQTHGRRDADFDVLTRVARLEQTMYGTGDPDGTSLQRTMREVRDEQRTLRESVDKRLNRILMVFLGALVTFGATAATLLLQGAGH